MNFLTELKSIFTGRHNLYCQLSIFSLIGLMAVFLNNKLTTLLGGIYGAYFGFAPYTPYLTYFQFLASIIIFMYLVGYLFKYSHDIFNSNSQNLPEISLDCFSVFLKSAPLILAWLSYYLIFSVIGLMSFYVFSPQLYIYTAVLICFLPFVPLCFAKFSQNLNLEWKYFSPIFAIRLIDKIFFPMLFLIFLTAIFAGVFGGLIYLIFFGANHLSTDTLKISVRIFGICFGMYFLYILSLAYIGQCAKLIKQNIN